VLCQASAAGALDLKKIDADFVKGVGDKAWVPIVQAAIKKCGAVATSKYYYIFFVHCTVLLIIPFKISVCCC
jgi:hypothetical protein